jgi:hypothetical protein
MKKAMYILISLVLLIGVESCTPKSVIENVGFDTDLTEESRGITIIHISQWDDAIKLQGEVFLDEGTLELEFLNPDGELVYTINASASEEISVDEIYPAEVGFWKLRYSSPDAKGYLRMHMTKSNY